MVLEAVRLPTNLTVQNVKDSALRGSQPTASPWGVVRSMSALSPKLCLEGIPEWVALRGNLDLLISKCLGSYHGLCQAAKKFGITVNSSSGRRKTKTYLWKSIAMRLRVCKNMPTLPKKRKWAELEADVIAAGGIGRSYVAGKRHRMTWLKKHKPS